MRRGRAVGLRRRRRRRQRWRRCAESAQYRPVSCASFHHPAIVGRDGLPVQGLHYVRVGDRNMVQSEATDENGLFNPRFAPGRAADEVLFGVGSFSVTTSANGNLDYENPVFADENGFLVAPYSPRSDWSGLRIDIGRDGDDRGVPKDSRKRYLASIFPSPPAPATATALTLDPYVSPRLRYDGKPVAGLHYIRVSPGEGCESSTPTAADGSFDALVVGANPLRVTPAATIVFALGPITTSKPRSNCVDRRQFATDGFAIATIEVNAAKVTTDSRPDFRGWHQEIVAITTQNGTLILQDPDNLGNEPAIVGSATDADKRLLASLNENEAGLSVSVFVRPRFRYDGGDVENLHYLRWNDNGVLDDDKSLVDPMLTSRPTEADGAFDVLVTANLRAGTTPVGQIFEIGSVLFALGEIDATHDDRRRYANVDFDLSGGGASLGILPLPGDSWRDKIVSVTHSTKSQPLGILRMQTETVAVDISEDLAIKRFLKAVVDNPSALAVEAKSVTLFSEPRVMRARHKIAGLDYIQADPDYQRMTKSAQTGDNGAFDPLILALAKDRSRLTVVEAAKILFASGEIIANARVSGGYEFLPTVRGGFQVGEAHRPSEGWNAQPVPIDPSSGILLPLRADTSRLLDAKERIGRFVASLQGEPRLREEVARELDTPSALAATSERLYLAQGAPSGKIVSYAIDEEGRLSDSVETTEQLSAIPALAAASGRLYFTQGFFDSTISSYRIDAGQLNDLRPEITSGLGNLGDLVASNGRMYVTDSAFALNPLTFEPEFNYFIKSYVIGTIDQKLSSGRELMIDFAPEVFAISDTHRRLFIAGTTPVENRFVAYSYMIGKNGALSNRRQILIPAGVSALLVAADGRLYVADDNGDNDRVVSYAIRGDGGLIDFRNEFVENLDKPVAIESASNRIYIAYQGAVDKIISYEAGSSSDDDTARRFKPFVYPRFLHGEESGQPVRGVSFIRVNDEGDPVMTVSAETGTLGFFDPLQDGVYDENEIQINQVLFGLGTIRASVGAPGGYQFDRSEPYVGFQIGAAPKPSAGWSGEDIWVGRKNYRLATLAGTAIDKGDLDRFNIASDGNGGKVASIAPVRVPNLPFENLPKLIYGGGDKDAPVGGAHYLRVGDSQMTVSRHTNPNGSFDPIGKSGESPRASPARCCSPRNR